jgi:hypothetical protein
MLVIMHAVELWRPYLLGQRFQIKTDHQSLKYFLEQRISSQEQQKWVTKLFGYDYEIIYKKGKENVVADALSRKYENEGSLFSLSFIVPDWLQAVHQEWLQDPKSLHMIQQLQNKAQAPPGYSWLQDELRYKGLIQVDIGGHPPFPNGSKQFSGHFGNLLFLAGFTSGAILRA